MSECDAILNQGIRDTNTFNSIDQVRAFVRRALSWSYDEFKQRRSASSGGGEFKIFEVLGISGGGQGEEEEFNRLKQEFSSNEESFFSKNALKAIYTEVTNESVVNAWLKCVTQGGVSAYFIGDPLEKFTLALTYRPDEESDRDLTITGVSYLYSQPEAGQPLNIDVGKTLQRFQSLVQACRRVDPKKPDSIAVTFDQGRVITVDLPVKPDEIIAGATTSNTTWEYETRSNTDVVTTGRFNIIRTGDVITGTRTKQTHNGQTITPITENIEGFRSGNRIKIYREVPSQNAVQFYDLTRNGTNAIDGRFYNYGNNDAGVIKLRR